MEVPTTTIIFSNLLYNKSRRLGFSHNFRGRERLVSHELEPGMVLLALADTGITSDGLYDPLVQVLALVFAVHVMRIGVFASNQIVNVEGNGAEKVASYNLNGVDYGRCKDGPAWGHHCSGTDEEGKLDLNHAK